MATLEHTATGARRPLAGRHLIGRSAHCDLTLSDRHASSEHAALCWTGEAWEVRDLGSRNGTWVGGARLAAGGRALLRLGAAVSFGRVDDPWRLVDAGAPVAFARREHDGAVVAEDAGLLALPEDGSPEVTVYRDAQGRWWSERGGDAQPVSDQALVVGGGAIWRLRLPALPVGTASVHEADADAPAAPRLRFGVSRDGEYVSLEVTARGRTIDLGARAHHQCLLALARARLKDMADPAVVKSAHGWVYLDELLRMLDVEELRLNVDIYRARKQFAAAGVEGAAGIVERRATTRQLRLGTDDVEITEV